MKRVYNRNIIILILLIMALSVMPWEEVYAAGTADFPTGTYKVGDTIIITGRAETYLACDNGALGGYNYKIEKNGGLGTINWGTPQVNSGLWTWSVTGTVTDTGYYTGNNIYQAKVTASHGSSVKTWTGNITLVNTASITGSVIINKKVNSATDGYQYANISPLRLWLSASDDISPVNKLKVYVKTSSTAPAPSDTGWVDFPSDSVLVWDYKAANGSVPGLDGTVTVYVWFKDERGFINGSTISDSIIFDSTSVTGSVAIDDGEILTKSKTVTLTLNKDSLTDGIAAVSKVLISNDNINFKEEEYPNDTNKLEWDIDYSTDGEKTVYVKYLDWSGNTTNPAFTDKIVYDSHGPVGELAISGGAATTSQPNVTLSIAELESAFASKMMISNREDFKGAIWEPYSSIREDWPLDSVTSGVKTVYIKFMDKWGNEGQTISSSIEYVSASDILTGLGSGDAPYSFLNSVQHYQSINIGQEQEILVTGPMTPIQPLSETQYSNLNSHNVLFNDDRANYSLRFNITSINAELIQDMVIEFDFNKRNEDGIYFVIEKAVLNKYINGAFQPIKILTPTYLGKNLYTIGLGNDDGGAPLIAANGGGDYTLDYTARIITQQYSSNPDNTPVEILNHSEIKIYSKNYTEFPEPFLGRKQFDIVTRVSRAQNMIQ